MESEKQAGFQSSHSSHAQKPFTDFLRSSPKRVTRPYEISRDVTNLEKTKPVTNILRRGSFRGRLEDIFKNVTAGKLPPAAVQRLQENVAPARQIEQVIKNQNQSNATQQSSMPTSSIIPVNDLVDIHRDKYSIGERQARCKLASLYRVIERKGWTMEIYNHVSLRAPGAEEHFLINAFGLCYSEITASNLVKVNLHGDIIDPGSTQLGISKAGYVIHSAIHEARRDIKCIIHLHTPQGAGVSTMICGLLPLCQEALIVGGVSYHTYRGIACDEAEKAELVQDLGPVNKAMILHNHGLLAMGSTVEEAYHICYNLVTACETQVKALSGGLANVMLVNNELAAKVFATVRQGGGGGVSRHSKLKIGELEYEALMRELDNLGYNTGYPYKISDLLLPAEATGPHEDIDGDGQAVPSSTGRSMVTPEDNEVAEIAKRIRQELNRIKQQKSKMAAHSPTPPKIMELEKGKAGTNHDDGNPRQMSDTKPMGMSLAHIAMNSPGRTRPIYSGLNAVCDSTATVTQQTTPLIKSSLHKPSDNDYEIVQMTPTIQGIPTGSRVPVHRSSRLPAGYLPQPMSGHIVAESTHNNRTLKNSAHNDRTMVDSTLNDDSRDRSSAWDFLNERQSHGPLPLSVNVTNSHEHQRGGITLATDGPSQNVPTSLTSLQPPLHTGSRRSPHHDHRSQLATWPEEQEKQDNGSSNTKPTSRLIQEPNRAQQHHHIRLSPLMTVSHSMASGSNGSRVSHQLPTHYTNTSSDNVDTSHTIHDGKVTFRDTRPQQHPSLPSSTANSVYREYDDIIVTGSQTLPTHNNYTGHYIATSGSSSSNVLPRAVNPTYQAPSSEPLYISSIQEMTDGPSAVNAVSGPGLTDRSAHQPHQLPTIITSYDNPLTKVEETAKAVANSTNLSVQKLSHHKQQQLLNDVTAGTSEGMNGKKRELMRQLQNDGKHLVNNRNSLSTDGVQSQLPANSRVFSNKQNGFEEISSSLGKTNNDAEKNVLSNHLVFSEDQVTSMLTPPTHYSSHTDNSPLSRRPLPSSSHQPPSPSSQQPHLPLSQRPPSLSSYRPSLHQPLPPSSQQPPLPLLHQPSSSSSHSPPPPSLHPPSSPSSFQPFSPALSTTATTTDPSNVYLYSPPTLDLTLTGLDKATNIAKIVAESTNQSVEKLSRTHKLVLDSNNGGVTTAVPGVLGERDDMNHKRSLSDR